MKDIPGYIHVSFSIIKLVDAILKTEQKYLYKFLRWSLINYLCNLLPFCAKCFIGFSHNFILYIWTWCQATSNVGNYFEFRPSQLKIYFCISVSLLQITTSWNGGWGPNIPWSFASCYFWQSTHYTRLEIIIWWCLSRDMWYYILDYILQIKSMMCIYLTLPVRSV